MRVENSLIKLRNLEVYDIDFLSDIENDPDLWEVSNTNIFFSEKVLKKHIEDSKKDIFIANQARFIIENIRNKKQLGLIDLFDFNPTHLRAGIGIVISKSERRKKYAENAINLLKDYCSKILRLNQIYCNISYDNFASIKLFEKAGFKLTGKKEQWINTSEGFKDVLFYQLIL